MKRHFSLLYTRPRQMLFHLFLRDIYKLPWARFYRLYICQDGGFPHPPFPRLWQIYFLQGL